MHYFNPPVPLLADQPDPQPVDGCPQCEALDKRLKAAKTPTAHTDIRVLLRRHLEKEHTA